MLLYRTVGLTYGSKIYDIFAVEEDRLQGVTLFLTIAGIEKADERGRGGKLIKHCLECTLPRKKIGGCDESRLRMHRELS